MAFDIHQLDEIDQEFDDADQLLGEYVDALIELFLASPEGKAHQQTYPHMGFWAAQLITRGNSNLGVSLPQMTRANVDELLTDIFPSKISLSAPDEAAAILPELTAFWEYLRREHQLANADEILAYLAGVDATDVIREMNNPANFGMAKAFFMAGQAAGFDMTDEVQANVFMAMYNEAQLAVNPVPGAVLTGSTPRRGPADAKKKGKRKAASESRKRNRRKKK